MLIDRIRELAIDLPEDVIEVIARELERRADASDDVGRVLARVNQPKARDQLAELLEAWRSEQPELSGPAVAWSLRAAATTDAWHRARQQVELVWTGPAPHGTTLRRTDQALLEMIRGATKRITIVTFAAYKVPEIHSALLAAGDRGVEMTFIVESPDSSDGKVDFDPLPALGAYLAKNARAYVWPLDQRARDLEGRHGTLHAKCAVVDDARLLISSANFTGDAMLLNLELGILIEGGELPRRVSEHLETLRSRGVLSPIE